MTTAENPVHITDEGAYRAVVDWMTTRGHAATFAAAFVLGADVLESHESDPEAEAASAAMYLTGRVSTADLRECWRYYANEVRRASGALTDISFTRPPAPVPETAEAEAYAADVRAHFRAVAAVLAEVQGAAVESR